MQLEPPVNLLPPSICIICETQPDGDFVVDTLKDLKTGVYSVFNGRKYVCERCVGEFAKLFGYEHGDNVQRANIDLEFARNELANVRQRVVELAEHIRDFAVHPGASSINVTPPITESATEVRDAPKVIEQKFEDVFGAAPPAKKEKSAGAKSTIGSTSK